MNLIERLEKYQKTTLRIVLFGFPLILFGVLGEEFTLANLGWTVSTIAIATWVGLSMTQRLMIGRIPFDLVHSEEDEY
jgi:hypothetical protein